MIKTAEYVSLGHPDKIADYISSAVLDECISQDPAVRYAVEVMVKNNHIILGGEISGNIRLNNLTDIVKQALRDIGYDEKMLEQVRPLLEEISSMNAFCAWMREAVKAKDKELNVTEISVYGECTENPDIFRASYY